MGDLQKQMTELFQEFEKIWNTKLDINSNFPVSRDLLRLAKKFKLEKKILKEGNEEVTDIPYTKSLDKEANMTTVIADLLNGISKNILLHTNGEREGIKKEEEEINIDENVPKKENCVFISEEMLNKDGSTTNHESLTQFLITKYGDSHPVLKILKLCHQGIVNTFLSHLGIVLVKKCKPPIRCKDIMGSWQLVIRRNENASASYVSVVHQRKEQAVQQLNDYTLVNLFTITWEIEISFDPNMEKLTTVEAKLLNLDWSSYDENLRLSENQKAKAEKQFKKAFGTPRYPPVKEAKETGLFNCSDNLNDILSILK